MLGSSALDTAIGLCLFFLLVSLLCSGIREAGETLLKSRARDLERGLRMILDDQDGSVMMPAVLGHGLLASLSQGDYDPAILKTSRFGGGLHLPIGQRGGFPSYIPAQQFAAALLDVVARGSSSYPVSAARATAADLRQAVAQLPSARLQRVILSALDVAGDDLTQLRSEIETWFNGSMDRVSGWYKRRTQIVLFLIGLGVAVMLNLDALTVATHLSQDDALRAAAVAEAGKMQTLPGGGADSIGATKKQLEAIGYPMGWRKTEDGWPRPAPQMPLPTCPAATTVAAPPCTPAEPALSLGTALAILLGWLVTAFAVTLGAPFWFDLLNRFMVIRSTVKPHQKSPEESSADAQSGQPDPATKRAADGGGDGGNGGNGGNGARQDQPAAATGLEPRWSEDVPEAWADDFVNEGEVAL